MTKFRSLTNLILPNLDRSRRQLFNDTKKFDPQYQNSYIANFAGSRYNYRGQDFHFPSNGSKTNTKWHEIYGKDGDQKFFKPGEEIPVEFLVEPEMLAYYNRDMEWIVEKGTFTIMVGSSSRQSDLKSVKLEVN